MRRKALLIVALATLGAAVAAGAGNASSGSGGLLDLGTSGVSINLLGGQDLPVLGTLPACANLRDDDGDGKVDLADAGCAGPLDGDEYNAPAAPPPDDGGGSGGGGGGVVHNWPHAGGQHSGSGELSVPGRHQKPMTQPATRAANGTPTQANPTLTIADFGPAPIGVPSFIIDQFTIPPFLLSIYQACGTEYGIPWEILAAINRIETGFGTNLNVSTAGAVGWMQFLPSTWKAYGVDANNDGRKDPYNPVDAICAAARYLRAAGGETDLRRAIFAYNHADWYVDEVVLYARQYGRLPEDLIGSVVGLTQGNRFPVAARARYADDISEREAAARAKPSAKASGNLADVISSSPTRRGINIYSRSGAPVVAVNDGVIKRIGHDERRGRFIVLEDAYGNNFTYAQLGRVADTYPVPKQHKLRAADFRLVSPKRDAAPTAPATAGAHAKASTQRAGDLRTRLGASAPRSSNLDRASLTGQLDDLLTNKLLGYETVKRYLGGVLRFDAGTMTMRPLHEGAKVIAGTVLGRLGKVDKLAPHLNFAIRPAGRGAPRIDPKPILDGWKLLEATAIYRAAGRNPFRTESISQILLMTKTQLERRVLADPRLAIYECGRQDIRTGQIDQRVLAGMEYLASNGFRLTVTSLKCGHGFYTVSGNASAHAFGDAMDIAAVNGIPILGNQGGGTITEAVIETLLQLQGTERPQQIISLMKLGDPSFSMADHADHIHVGWTIQQSAGRAAKQFQSLLKPGQWTSLIERIAQIPSPKVSSAPSRYALPAGKHGHKRAVAGD